MDRNCEVCKHHTEKGCCKWECQFEPKLSERDLHFRYLDGCADGLNEARKDTIRELEKVKEEIDTHICVASVVEDLDKEKYKKLSFMIEAIIDGHISKLKGGAECD